MAFCREIVYPYWFEDQTWREFTRGRYPRARAAHRWGGSWR